MDVFEDARETTDVMEYEDTIETNPVNHGGEVVAVPSIPSTQFRFFPIGPPTMLNAPPSTSMVSSSHRSKCYRLLSGRKPTIHMRTEMDQVTKRLSVEVNDSAKLRVQVYEQRASYKRRLTAAVAKERALAKTEREEVEKNALERDRQWQKRLSESIARERAEMEKKLEAQDRVWQNRLNSIVEDATRKLQEQAEQQEHSRAQMERKMKENQEKDLKRVEESLAKVQVSRVLVH
jgi:flagellar biosynthesis GTPase FlhF